MSDWTHPAHKRSISPRIFDTMVTGPLTDRKISEYVRRGFYENRKYYQGELRKLRTAKDIFEPAKQKRVVYNPLTQELDEREI